MKKLFFIPLLIVFFFNINAQSVSEKVEFIDFKLSKFPKEFTNTSESVNKDNNETIFVYQKEKFSVVSILSTSDYKTIPPTFSVKGYFFNSKLIFVTIDFSEADQYDFYRVYINNNNILKVVSEKGEYGNIKESTVPVGVFKNENKGFDSAKNRLIKIHSTISNL